MQINFGVVPFSCAGSYMAFSYPQDAAAGFEKALTLRVLYGMLSDQENYPIFFMDNKSLNKNTIYTGRITATETDLRMTDNVKELELCFQNADTVYMRSNAVFAMTKRRLSAMDRVLDHGGCCMEVAGYDTSLVFEIRRGSFMDHSVWGKEGTGVSDLLVEFSPDDEGIFEAQLSLSGLSYRKPDILSFEAVKAAARLKYEQFSPRFSCRQEEYQYAMAEAAYISWHTIVAPRGYVKYPVMLMSKNKMNQVWSWDYAINALAMVDKDPELAYGQFLAMAACQDETGFYADCFQSRTMVTGFVKPPIQGFILRKMFRIHKPDYKVMQQLYDSLTRLTDWWFRYRGGKDGIPCYHHGNDSGWDNSTVFAEGVPVKSPDLPAWLIEQMDFLAETAMELGKKEEASAWQERGRILLKDLLEKFVVAGQFVAFKEPEHHPVTCKSLLLFLPLLLGDKLPEELRNKMIDHLMKEGSYITEYGIASEPLDSSSFVEDGYWRGAIWPPTALIMTELLIRNGKNKEALKNARQFCDLCAKEGFFENYSAVDGHGLRDSAFTWTASTFIILLRDYLEKESII